MFEPLQRKEEQHSHTIIQPSLEIGKEDDEQEKEANHVADKVMRMSDQNAANLGRMHTGKPEVKMMSTGREIKKMTESPPLMQKMTESRPFMQKMGSDEDEEKIQKMSDGEEEEKMVDADEGIQKMVDTPSFMNKMSDGNGGALIASQKVEQGINNSKGSGQSLPENTQQDLGEKMNADFSDVKIHTDEKAVQMNKEVGAKAFTHGNDIYFNNGQYNPTSNQGKHLLAHELTHTVQQGMGVQRKIQKALGNPTKGKAGEYGQTVNASSRTLISDLTSPVTKGSTSRMEVHQTGDEIGPSGAVESYQWKVYNIDQQKYISNKQSDSPVRNIFYNSLGKYRIEVDVLINGSVFTTLKIEQTVKAEDVSLTTTLASPGYSTNAKTYRELINDFSSYINTAADSTGTNGIPPRMLASVLMIEIANRPKEGRNSEINVVNENYNVLKDGGWLFYEQKRTNRSIGVGQIRTSTAAMVEENTTWIDQDMNDKETDRNKINKNFMDLNLEKRNDIFEELRFPKSNIMMAAKLLTKLKNRTNRFPTLSKKDFVANEHAVEVIATEYNMGSTNSQAKDAQASPYGQVAWLNLTTDPLIIKYFPNE